MVKQLQDDLNTGYLYQTLTGEGLVPRLSQVKVWYQDSHMQVKVWYHDSHRLRSGTKTLTGESLVPRLSQVKVWYQDSHTLRSGTKTLTR